MIMLLFNFLMGPLIFLLIGFGLGYYYFGNKEKVNAIARKKAAEEFDKLMAGARDRIAGSPSPPATVQIPPPADDSDIEA